VEEEEVLVVEEGGEETSSSSEKRRGELDLEERDGGVGVVTMKGSEGGWRPSEEVEREEDEESRSSSEGGVMPSSV